MQILQFILHIDKYLSDIVSHYGALTYALLFLIIFAETGLVVTPFLPGDSLLFAVGALSATGILSIWPAYLLFLVAVICGDNVNYWLGRRIGPRVFSKENSRIFNKNYLARTESFYERHGSKTIILARFIPIVRTFAPFVAGVGQMRYRTFLLFSIIGGFFWVTLFTWLGYLFGNIKIIRENFEFAVVGIILFSLLPILYEYVMHKKRARRKDLEKANYRDLKKIVEKEN